MKISVVIPTYWTSTNAIIKHGTPDAIYDHPTPLESDGTLPRLLDSLKHTDLPGDSTTIIVIVAVTHKTLEQDAEEKTKEIISNYKDCFDIKQFFPSTLKKMYVTKENIGQLLSLYGYSNVRNAGLAAGQILKSDIIIFLDDDTIVNDQRYFRKVQKHVGKTIGSKLLGGVAGYYTNEWGNYYLRVDPEAWWKLCWPKEKKMNESFKVINSMHRLTETTFAFGGNMVLHWKMFERVPFDPYITRGEDMDLLVNAKMFGFKFMLDTKLRVLHLPGEGKRLWSEMRQDLRRFVYMREKMLSQKSVKDIEHVSIDSLKPYPGFFLGFGACFKFVTSSVLNSFHSLLRRDIENFSEFSRNIREIRSAVRFAKKHSLNYFKFQKKWATHIPKIRGHRDLGKILSSC